MFKRVVLKLSGEVFGGGEVGVDPDVVANIARQIASAVRSGVQVAVVVGGGNFFRGAELQKRGMDRARNLAAGGPTTQHGANAGCAAGLAAWAGVGGELAHAPSH